MSDDARKATRVLQRLNDRPDVCKAIRAMNGGLTPGEACDVFARLATHADHYGRGTGALSFDEAVDSLLDDFRAGTSAATTRVRAAANREAVSAASRPYAAPTAEEIDQEAKRQARRRGGRGS